MTSALSSDSENMTPGSGSGPGPEASARGRRRKERGGNLDSAVRALLGLVVLWASLLLIFSAHHMSDSYIRPEKTEKTEKTGKTKKTGLGSLMQDQAFQALDPRETLLLPFSMRLQGSSPGQALANIAAFVDFEATKSEMKALGKDRRNYHFDSMPLYKALHAVLNDAKLGLALRGREMRIFAQQLDFKGAPGSKCEMDWKAELELNRDRVLIVPSGALDISLSVHLVRDFTNLKPQWNTVQVEVWKGTECLTMAKAALDEKGKAQISMSAVENIAFSIARLAAAPGDKPGRYALGFYYQAFD